MNVPALKDLIMRRRTIYLSRLLGLLILIAAISMLVDKRRALETMRSLLHDQSALMIIALLGTAAGLAIVLGHQVWSGGTLSVMVTIFGWALFVRSTVLLFLPLPVMAQLVEWFRFDEWFYRYLGLSAVLGLYLTGHGFVARERPRALSRSGDALGKRNA
jgi:hypothetical protein